MDSPRGPTCPLVGGPRQLRVAHCHGPPSCQALRTQCVYIFSTTPGGESRTEFVELPLCNPGGTLGPLVEPSIAIKLRTQILGACSLNFERAWFEPTSRQATQLGPPVLWIPASYDVLSRHGWAVTSRGGCDFSHASPREQGTQRDMVCRIIYFTSIRSRPIPQLLPTLPTKHGRRRGQACGPLAGAR